jgi:C1A family cysteine protease
MIAPYDVGTTSLDWRDKNVIQSVQDQGICGSCWAFSTAANVESAYAVKTGLLNKLSEQYSVSCDPVNGGCNGGLGEYALEFLYQNECILGADYSYVSGVSGDDETCNSSGKTTQQLLISPGYEMIELNYAGLKKALLIAPFTICFEVVDSFYFVTSGVYQPSDCTNKANALNHEMQAIGYGVLNGLEYVLIRN